MKRLLSGLGALALLALTPVLGWAQEAAAAAPTIDSGNTTWVLVSAALVMLMTPGLAFFYAGMVNRRNVVATLMQNFAALAVVSVLWVVVGYSLVFTEGSQWIGGLSKVMLTGTSTEIYEAASIPSLAFIAFQMMFAIISPALIIGAIAERIKFKAWLVIMAAWSLLCYVPVAHWVWGPGGWLAGLGALDFAGGLVVHITAGFSALVAALLYGKRSSGSHTIPTNDITMIMLGAGLLWFGWFGFNAGSALTSGALAAHAFMTTFVAAAVAFLGWMLVDTIRTGKSTAVGGAVGIVAGLVAITPAAGFVDINAAMIIGAAAGVLCNLAAVLVKKISHIDDALDVFACHGFGGVIGAILTGVFAQSSVNSAVTTQGLAISGETTLFLANLSSVVIVACFSMLVTFVIIQVVKAFMTIRTSVDEEHKGLDATEHGEFARRNEQNAA